MTTAALLLAAALILIGGPRVAWPPAGAEPTRCHRDPETPTGTDPFAFASAMDVFAVCLSSGLPIAAAASATAPIAPASLGAMLSRAADLLALGADPDVTWAQPDGTDDCCGALARLARRSASSGSALADGVAELAEQSRQDSAHAATAAAERAGVLIAGPLGLCFLPAFVCLGIVPVVAGLAGQIFGAGLL